MAYGGLSYQDYAANTMRKHYVAEFYESLHHDWILSFHLQRLVNNLDSAWVENVENYGHEKIRAHDLTGCRVSRMKCPLL